MQILAPETEPEEYMRIIKAQFIGNNPLYQKGKVYTLALHREGSFEYGPVVVKEQEKTYSYPNRSSFAKTWKTFKNKTEL